MLWIPAGIFVGTVIGALAGPTTFGMSIGMMLGSTVTLGIEARRKKISFVWPFMTALAALFIVAFRILHRG